jgi:hypothetical protein
MNLEILNTKKIIDRYFGRNSKFLSFLNTTAVITKNIINDKLTHFLLDLHSTNKNELHISGISKIVFEDSIQIESKKHLGLSSGWKNSYNYYKVGVNNDYENDENIDEYMDRLAQKQKYVTQRKYPKRHKKYRSNVNKFFRS